MDEQPAFFDTHVHLDRSPLRENLTEQVRGAVQAGIREFLVPGVRREGWAGLLETVEAVAGARAAPGLHPLAAGDWNDESAAELEKLLECPEVAALGEIGLDGALEAPSAAQQEAAFRGQLRLAVARGLPVLIHCRKATGKVLRILHEEGAGAVGGIFHAFSGSPETAREAIALNFALGFGGSVTFPNARRGPEVLEQVPAEAIVLETDAPDLAPHPHRGRDNRPAWLTLVALQVAEIRNWSLAETARITTTNARRVLKIKQ